MQKTLLPADTAILGKSVGMNICLHFIMQFGGLEILSDCHYLAIHSAKVVHCLQDFLPGLAESEHDSRFGADSLGGDVAEHFERTVVGSDAAHLGSKPSYGLHIVAYHIRALRDNHVDKLFVSPEIGD